MTLSIRSGTSDGGLLVNGNEICTLFSDGRIQTPPGNVAGYIGTAGTGSLQFFTMGNAACAGLRVNSMGSNIVTNGVIVYPAASGNNPAIASADLGGTGNANIGLNIASQGTGDINFVMNGVARATFNGVLGSFNLTNLLDLSTSATAGQIKFPATQNASTNANTLDDYEEGVWTPVIAGATTTGVGTYTAQEGTYTKIGNLVTLSARMGWSTHSGTGYMVVTGIPYTVRGVAGDYFYGLCEWSGLAAISGTPAIALYANGTSAVLIGLSTTTGISSTVAMDTAVSLLYFSITYRTA